MHCAGCGSENREGAKFCNDCGAPLSLHCPSCQAENRPGARFCNACGTPLLAQPAASQRQARPGKQREGQVARRSRKQPASDSGVRPVERAPASYTPRHLAQRILAEQAAREARGAPEGERKIITACSSRIRSARWGGVQRPGSAARSPGFACWELEAGGWTSEACNGEPATGEAPVHTSTLPPSSMATRCPSMSSSLRVSSWSSSKANSSLRVR